jgi:hypothetical protein
VSTVAALVTDLGTLGGLKSTPAVINNGQIAGSEDNEMIVRDGLLDGHKQLGMNLNLSVAASPAGTPASSPATSPVRRRPPPNPPAAPGRPAPSTANHPT